LIYPIPRFALVRNAYRIGAFHGSSASKSFPLVLARIQGNIRNLTHPVCSRNATDTPMILNYP
jgi:hypothetical protein